MNQSLFRWVSCGCLFAALGCQNSMDRLARFGDRDSLESRYSRAGEDSSGRESGRGHSSMAAEFAEARSRGNDLHSPEKSDGSAMMVQRLLERGYEADAHGRLPEAKLYYEQVLAEQPYKAEAHHRLAILADRAGDFAAAETHYQMALRETPNDADVLNDVGYSYFLQGRAAESERYLKRALRISPQHSHVKENLALLYDPAKAEKILLTAMEPRQARRAFAQLFPNSTGGMPAEKMPPQELASKQSTEEIPHGLDELQRKMAEARLRSIAEREQKSGLRPQAGVADQLAGIPQSPATYPPQLPPQRGFGPPRDVPDGRINDAFRSIDNNARLQRGRNQNAGMMADASSYSQQPTPREIGRVPNARPMNAGQPNANSSQIAEQRAEAPQWNTPPQHWPQYVPETPPVQQAGYNPAESGYPPNAAVPSSLPSAARRAAEIGMAAGPGAIFPPVDDAWDSSSQQPGPMPAVRSLPGTNSRNGAKYPQPGVHGLNGYGDSSAAQSLDSPPGWGQLAGGPQNQTLQPENRPAEFGGQNQAGPNGWSQDPYEQMRAAQNAQLNEAQRALAPARA